MNRKQIIFKNVSLGFFYKLINMALVFVTLPLVLNYLDKELYGVWVTIFSVVNIVYFVDGGIGNGLKTKLTEALSHQNFSLAKTYISTAYVSIGFVAFLLAIIGTVLIFTLDVQYIFNTSLDNQSLRLILFLTLVMVSCSFVLNLYKAFYYAVQQSAKVELAMLVYQVFILLSVLILMSLYPQNLLVVAVVYGLSNIGVALLFTFRFFSKHPVLKPAVSSYSSEKRGDLMGLSIEFFIIQLCMIVIFTSDNLIITRLIGPVSVTQYDIVYKLFHLFVTLSVIAQDPLWALYTDAYQKKDYEWIRKTLIRLNLLFVLFLVVLTCFCYFSETIIYFWTQKDLAIPKSLLYSMMLFVIVRAYGIIYMNFLNSIGKITLQKWLFIFGAVINIPVSVILVKYVDMGSSGVIIGTSISILALSVLLPIQCMLILKQKMRS